MSWDKLIRRVVPYTPGEQPDDEEMIKLNTNENPYPPAPGVQSILDHFETDSFRLYPDPGASLLTEALAEYYKVDKDQVFVGIGSDDVLALSFLTFFHSDKPILFPDITYSFYEVWADLYRIPYQVQPLDEEFRMKKEDYYKENGGILFPNPNAPTGILEDLGLIEDILKKNPDVVVIVDEAYIDFGGKSALPLISKYDNLLVVQTFSKSRSMAGVRIGFAIGSKKLIACLNDVKFSFNSYTLNTLSMELGVQSLKENEYFLKTVENIIHTREKVKREMTLLGFTYPDSYGNFLFVTHPEIKAPKLQKWLKEHHIYVRYFNKPGILNYLRITIGTMEEMDLLLTSIKEYQNNVSAQKRAERRNDLV